MLPVNVPVLVKVPDTVIVLAPAVNVPSFVKVGVVTVNPLLLYVAPAILSKAPFTTMAASCNALAVAVVVRSFMVLEPLIPENPVEVEASPSM